MNLLIYIGLAYFFSGIISYIFPPRWKNKYYGYRTKRSMLNKKSWELANKYSSRYLIIGGGFLFTFHFLFSHMKEFFLISLVLTFSISISIILGVEFRLKEKFDDFGKPK